MKFTVKIDLTFENSDPLPDVNIMTVECTFRDGEQDPCLVSNKGKIEFYSDYVRPECRWNKDLLFHGYDQLNEVVAILESPEFEKEAVKQFKERYVKDIDFEYEAERDRQLETA